MSAFILMKLGFPHKHVTQSGYCPDPRYSPMVTKSCQLLLFLLLAYFPLFLLSAEPKWERFDNCALDTSAYHDGDSFRVRIAPDTYRTFRLYFVDALERSSDNRFPKRLAEQDSYFSVSRMTGMMLGDYAQVFTLASLQLPFTVWTCWQKCPGTSKQQRYYAMVSTQDGRYLSSVLVQDGLARIYGKRITLPDGMTSRAYLEHLEGWSGRRNGRTGEPGNGDSGVL